MRGPGRQATASAVWFLLLLGAAEAGLRTLGGVGGAGGQDASSAEQAAPPLENWDELRDKLKELHKEAEAWARENPTPAMLAAVGAGFVIGLLLKR